MLTLSEIAETVREEFEGADIIENASMREHTSFKIGGRARYLFTPKTKEELFYILSLCRDSNVRCEIIGNGTNVLFSDDLPELAVIKTSDGLDKVELTGDREIYAECGATLSKIAVFAMRHGLEGFEFAHGIPGSLGGAVVMNAGAYGGEIKDVVTKVDAVSGTYTAEECDFSYRHSRFSDSGDIVLGAAITLQKGDPDAIKGRMDELLERRRSSQPLNMPSAGSTFKRPVGGYAAALIDQAGLKGYSVGGAKVSEKHAGFVVNSGGATFDDVVNLMEHIKKTVFENSGIMLEPEVKIIR